MDAQDGYFKAKRQMTEALDARIQVLEIYVNNSGGHGWNAVDKARLEELKEFRNYVRNGMLWKNEDLESADS